jgi:NAD(P)-dependent dehydrogenase (short-subunit alcohol dehydrogenase family)
MRVMHINVNAMFMLTSTLLPLLKLSQDASVVFTSSSVGRKGRAYWGAYGVSKFATEGLMQTLADELEGVAPVRANSINPAPRAPACAPRPTRGKPAEQPDAGRDHAGVPVPDGAGQYWHQRAGVQRTVMLCRRCDS